MGKLGLSEEEILSPASSRPALHRFFARTNSATSKRSVSGNSRPGSAAVFKHSRPYMLALMLPAPSADEKRSSFAIRAFSEYI